MKETTCAPEARRSSAPASTACRSTTDADPTGRYLVAVGIAIFRHVLQTRARATAVFIRNRWTDTERMHVLRARPLYVLSLRFGRKGDL